MKSFTKIDDLRELLSEIQHLQNARDLLQEIWVSHGDSLPDELRYRLNDYFKFDDSE